MTRYRTIVADLGPVGILLAIANLLLIASGVALLWSVL